MSFKDSTLGSSLNWSEFDPLEREKNLNRRNVYASQDTVQAHLSRLKELFHEEEIQQVVEGVLAAEAVKEVAEDLGIEMPICHQVYRILYEGASPREAVGALMGRKLRSEHEQG